MLYIHCRVASTPYFELKRQKKKRKWHTIRMFRKIIVQVIIEQHFVIGASKILLGGRPLSWVNSKQNRLCACGARLDRSSTKVVI